MLTGGCLMPKCSINDPLNEMVCLSELKIIKSSNKTLKRYNQSQGMLHIHVHLCVFLTLIV